MHYDEIIVDWGKMREREIGRCIACEKFEAFADCRYGVGGGLDCASLSY